MASLAVRAPKIALLSGSLRKGSFNSQLIGSAERVASNLGAETSIINIADYSLPVYHQDLEVDGKIPKTAVDLKAALGEADAWIISSPEYNGFISPLLLNVYTWCSRGDKPGAMYATFSGKSATVLSASPGAMGGLRTLNPHREILTNLGVNVLPHSVAIGASFKAFDEEENLVDTCRRVSKERMMCMIWLHHHMMSPIAFLKKERLTESADESADEDEALDVVVTGLIT